MKALPDWISLVLRFTGITNAVWGVTFALFTGTMLRWAEMPVPEVLFPWKVTGYVSVVFGIAYILAAANPMRHIMIVGTGFVIKFTGTTMIIGYLLGDAITIQLLLFFTVRDGLWTIVFAVMLYHIFKAWQAPSPPKTRGDQSDGLLDGFSTQKGDSLDELSFSRPLFLVFLRHFGCTFCREAIGVLREKRESIEGEGMQIIFVHMGDPGQADRYFEKYRFQGATHVSDPDCILYQRFQLKRGSFNQLFGLKSWVRGFQAGVLKGYGLGKLVGDGFRMPGVFVLYRGKIVKAYRHTHAADQPDYQDLASCELV